LLLQGWLAAAAKPWTKAAAGHVVAGLTLLRSKTYRSNCELLLQGWLAAAAKAWATAAAWHVAARLTLLRNNSIQKRDMYGYKVA
jgi:hypothetical protein